MRCRILLPIPLLVSLSLSSLFLFFSFADLVLAAAEGEEVINPDVSFSLLILVGERGGEDVEDENSGEEVFDDEVEAYELRRDELKRERI